MTYYHFSAEHFVIYLTTLLMYIILPFLLEYGLQYVHEIIMLGTTAVFSEISSRVRARANLLVNMSCIARSAKQNESSIYTNSVSPRERSLVRLLDATWHESDATPGGMGLEVDHRRDDVDVVVEHEHIPRLLEAIDHLIEGGAGLSGGIPELILDVRDALGAGLAHLGHEAEHREQWQLLGRV
jgi:hypothetical protein